MQVVSGGAGGAMQVVSGKGRGGRGGRGGAVGHEPIATDIALRTRHVCETGRGVVM